MRRLPETVKRRIVEHLACYRLPHEIVDLLLEEFGLAITARHVRAYDPMSFQFAGGGKWTDYHALVRKRFEAEIGEIAIAHRAYRLRQLQILYDEALASGARLEALSLLKQAARETDGITDQR